MTSDNERLKWLMENCVEGIRGLADDRHDYAMQIAEREGHPEPTETDELDGFRQMIDDAIAMPDTERNGDPSLSCRHPDGCTCTLMHGFSHPNPWCPWSQKLTTPTPPQQ